MTSAKFKSQSDKEWNESFLDKNNGLKQEHVDFILWNEQFYLLHSSLPDYEDCDLGISEDTWKSYWKNNSVRTALMTRQVPLRQVVDNKVEEQESRPVLTGRQIAAINALMDLNDQRTDNKKLKELGITTREYQSWRADPHFIQYMHQRAEKAGLTDLDDDAYRAFAENVREGDMGAIKMFFEMKGIYRSNDPQVMQFRILVQTLIDIIQQEVRDPEALTRISTKIMNAIAQNTTQTPNLKAIENRPQTPVGSLDF